MKFIQIEFSKLFVEIKTYYNQIIWRSTNVKLFQDDIESNAHFQMLIPDISLDNASSLYETSKRELNTTNGASVD